MVEALSSGGAMDSRDRVVICRRCQGSGWAPPSACAADRPCAACHGTGSHAWTVVFIQARIGSRRFPGKVLVPIGGIPMLQRVYDRACQIQGVDQVIVIAPHGEVFPGFTGPVWSWPDCDEHDVLDRYARAAEQAQADLIVRVTADCPFLDTELASQLVQMIQTRPHMDYLGVFGDPDGRGCEAFTAPALAQAASTATDPYDREHVTPWIRRGSRTGFVRAPVWTGPTKMSVDTPEDWQSLEAWMRAHHHPGPATPRPPSAAGADARIDAAVPQ